MATSPAIDPLEELLRDEPEGEEAMEVVEDANDAMDGVNMAIVGLLYDNLFPEEDTTTADPQALGEEDRRIDRAVANMLNDPKAKRENHRLAMERHRRRKRAIVDKLLNEENDLAQQLRQLLAQHKRNQAALATTAAAGAADRAMPASMEELRRSIADLVLVQKRLEAEHESLEDAVGEHEKFQRIVTAHHPILARERPPKSTQKQKQAQSISTISSNSEDDNIDSRVGRWVQYVDTEAPFYYEPVPETVCEDVARACFQRVQALRSGFNQGHFESILSAFCFGWRAELSLDSSQAQYRELRFRFSQRIPRSRATLTYLQERAWSIITTPALTSQLYSSTVVARLLQRVNKNMMVMMRNSPVKEQHLNYRYMSVNARMEYRTEDDELAVMLPMTLIDKEPPATTYDGPDRDKYPHEAPKLTWFKNGNLFFNFTEKMRRDSEMEDMIEIEHGGSLRCVSEEQGRYLMVEVVNTLIRWQTLVIPVHLIVSS